MSCPAFVCPTDTSSAGATSMQSTDFSGGVIAYILANPSSSVYTSYQRNLTSSSVPTWTSTDISGIIAGFIANSISLSSSSYATTTANGSVVPAMPFNALTNLASMNVYESFSPTVSLDITQLNAAYQAMQAGLQAEYCFYLGMYNCAISNYINGVQALASGASIDPTTSAWLTTAQQLNIKLSALLAVYSAIITELQQSVSNNQPTYQTLLTNIQQSQTALAGQKATTLRSVLATQQEMIAYTEEKNRRVRNQMLLYGGLNVVALGILFYIIS